MFFVEDSNYSAGSWKGHDFSSAYRAYDSMAGRGYASPKTSSSHSGTVVDTPRTSGRTAVPTPDSITTQSTHPLIIWNDVTGSMSTWPKTIFSKLPYLEHEAKTEYLGEDVEMLFGAIGDHTCDSAPLQARPFAKGTDLAARILELYPEGGGGGSRQESYELAALYTARNVHVPNALKPIVIMIGDEAPYEMVSIEDAREYAKVKLQSRMTTTEVFKELQRKFVFYLIRKPYHSSGSNSRSHDDQVIYEQWLRYVDANHIADLPDPGRVVDVIFGILAKEAGRIPYFMKEIEDRQRPDQYNMAYRSLKTILSVDAGKADVSHSGKSIMRIGDSSHDAKPLI